MLEDVGGLEDVFSHLFGIVTPTVTHSIIFQRGGGRKTTNQLEDDGGNFQWEGKWSITLW